MFGKNLLFSHVNLLETSPFCRGQPDCQNVATFYKPLNLTSEEYNIYTRYLLHKHNCFFVPINRSIFQIMALVELPHPTNKTDPDCFVLATNALTNLAVAAKALSKFAAGTGEIM